MCNVEPRALTCGWGKLISKDAKIIVKNLYKIFGDKPEKALQMSHEGMSKDDIFERIGHTVGVCDASFEIFEGEIFVVMGLSGSGKSTIVRLLNRLIEPSSGSVFFDGVDIAAMSQAELRDLRRKDMSMVFQSFALMPHLNVIDNASFGLELAGVDLATRHIRAQKALDQVGLSAYTESYPDELSGGMQQRVGLARALANDPSVMLMDEAFSALDPLIRTEMQDELLHLQTEHKRTIIFISHDLDEAMRIGDRIAIMQDGVVVQVGTPEEILNNPANDYVSSFFRGVDVAAVFTAGDIAHKSQVTVIERDGIGISTALTRLKNEDRDFGYIVSADQDFHGIVSVETLQKARDANKPIGSAMINGVEQISTDAQLTDVIGPVGSAPCAVPVVDKSGKYKGVITKARLLQTLAAEEDKKTWLIQASTLGGPALPRLANRKGKAGCKEVLLTRLTSIF